MDELVKKVEAVLFAVGRFITLEEISKIVKKDREKVKQALTELKVEYENRDSSLIVISESDMWKLSTREDYINLVRKIVSETELTKSQLETLAVIAFKYPIKQADLIRIRTNKAYDHLSELEKAGYISRQKYSRSKLIKLTDKFFEYFDLPQDKLKDRFKGFEQLAKTVEQKEGEIKKAKDEQKKIAEEAKKEAEQEKKIMDGEIEIDLVDDKGKKVQLDTFKEQAKTEELPKVRVVNEDIKEQKSDAAAEPRDKEEKLGELEVIDEPEIKKEEKKEDKVSIADIFTNGKLKPGESVSKQSIESVPQTKTDVEELSKERKERSKFKAEEDVEDEAMEQ